MQGLEDMLIGCFLRFFPGDVLWKDIFLGDILLGDILLGDILLGDVLLGDVLLGDVLYIHTNQLPFHEYSHSHIV